MLAKAQEVQKHFFFSLQKCFTVELNNNKSKQSGTKVKQPFLVEMNGGGGSRILQDEEIR